MFKLAIIFAVLAAFFLMCIGRSSTSALNSGQQVACGLAFVGCSIGAFVCLLTWLIQGVGPGK